jgi:3-hydroxyacyl-[acyl-carrier-protein] dehydratase
VLLKEARHVKYASFVEPGQALTVNVTMVEHGPRLSQLKAQGTVDGSIAVAARLVIERSNLADTNPSRAIADDVVKAKMRELFALLYSPVSGAAASA